MPLPAIEVFLTACALNTPNVCITKSAPAEHLDALACAADAAGFLNDFIKDHPTFRVTRWGCRRRQFDL